MARSKGFLFPIPTQSAAAFGTSFGHPARVEMLERLSKTDALSYDDLIIGIKLRRSTLGDHLAQLTKANLIKPVLLANNLAGYQLNRQQMVLYLNVVREKFNTTAMVRELETNRNEQESVARLTVTA